MSEEPSVTVLTVDFTDLAADGQDNPLVAAVGNLVGSAARVAASPCELVAAEASLTALRARVAGDLPALDVLLGHVLDLVHEVGRQL